MQSGEIRLKRRWKGEEQITIREDRGQSIIEEAPVSIGMALFRSLGQSGFKVLQTRRDISSSTGRNWTKPRNSHLACAHARERNYGKINIGERKVCTCRSWRVGLPPSWAPISRRKTRPNLAPHLWPVTKWSQVGRYIELYPPISSSDGPLRLREN